MVFLIIAGGQQFGVVFLYWAQHQTAAKPFHSLVSLLAPQHARDVGLAEHHCWIPKRPVSEAEKAAAKRGLRALASIHQERATSAANFLQMLMLKVRGALRVATDDSAGPENAEAAA